MEAQPVNMDALVVIDIQKDYFPGGHMELHQAGLAAERAAALIQAYRDAGKPVVHIQHEAVHPGAFFFLPGTEGMDFHPSVAPAPGEAVVVKHFANSFRETELADVLGAAGAKNLLVTGMMTQNCVDSTVRAGFDLGYTMGVAADGCATLPLTHAGRTASAEDVQTAFLAALGFAYAKVQPVQAWVDEL